jgi:hypothetical protein
LQIDAHAAMTKDNQGYSALQAELAAIDARIARFQSIGGAFDALLAKNVFNPLVTKPALEAVGSTAHSPSWGAPKNDCSAFQPFLAAAAERSRASSPNSPIIDQGNATVPDEASAHD